MNKKEMPLLSKWWKTKSARAAFRRDAKQRKEKAKARIAKMLAKKEAIARAAMQWREV